MMCSSSSAVFGTELNMVLKSIVPMSITMNKWLNSFIFTVYQQIIVLSVSSDLGMFASSSSPIDIDYIFVVFSEIETSLFCLVPLDVDSISDFYFRQFLSPIVPSLILSLLIDFMEHPGMMISMILGVNILSSISDNFRRSFISRYSYRAW